MATPDLEQLHRKAIEAWEAYRVDLERQERDRVALERLQPALSELRERFGFPWCRNCGHDAEHRDALRTPVVQVDEKLRSNFRVAVLKLIEAGGSWHPMVQR